MVDAELLSPAEWKKVIENRLGTKDFDIQNWKVNRMHTTGGFLGEHFLAQVTIRLHQPENCENVLHFFLKSEPKLQSSMREVTQQVNAFKKEVGAHDTIFPKLRKVLKENGKNMTWTCKCYYTRPDIVVLEDLSHRGFQSFSVRDIMTFKYFALAIEILGNLHAASLIFEEKQGSYFHLDAVYPEILQENFFVCAPNNPGAAWLEAGVRVILCLVEVIRGKSALFNIEKKIKEAMHKVYDMAKPSKRFRNVIGQGDLKRDNILYLHDGSQPVEAILVDYQLVRYAPPANDVMCFLYLTANREFREEYGAQLLAIYYERLSKNLQEHGLNAEKILPWEEFQESCEFYKIYAIILAACYGPAIFMKGEDISHVFESSENFERFWMVDRSSEVIQCYNTDSFYRKNVSQVIEELIEHFIEK